MKFFLHEVPITLTCFLFFCSYKAPEEGAAPDDPTADYMNLLGMVFSMFGLMMKVCTSVLYKILPGPLGSGGRGAPSTSCIIL